MKMYEIYFQPTKKIAGDEAIILGDLFKDFFNSLDEPDIMVHSWRNDGSVYFKQISIDQLSNTFVSLYCEKIQGQIRSVATCRFIDIGYDRQIYFCAKHDDDVSMFCRDGIQVIDVSNFLIEYDQFDGV